MFEDWKIGKKSTGPDPDVNSNYFNSDPHHWFCSFHKVRYRYLPLNKIQIRIWQNATRLKPVPTR